MLKVESSPSPELIFKESNNTKKKQVDLWGNLLLSVEELSACMKEHTWLDAKSSLPPACVPGSGLPTVALGSG